MKLCDKFNQAHTSINRISKQIGFDFDQPFAGLNRYLVYYLTIAIVGGVIVFWSMLTGSNYEMFKTMFVMIPGAQGCFRVIIFFATHSKIHHKLLLETQKRLKANEDESMEQQEIIKRGVKFGRIASYGVLFSYFWIFFGFTIYCWVHHFVFGSRYFPYSFKFPLEIESEYGYLFALTFHSLCSHAGGTNLATFDSFIVLFSTQAATIANLFAFKLKNIGEKIANLDKKDANYRANVKKMMKEIAEDHREYNDYLALFFEYANVSCYWIITLSVFGCAACLITIMTSEKY
jgi:hypothetical protein